MCPYLGGSTISEVRSTVGCSVFNWNTSCSSVSVSRCDSVLLVLSDIIIIAYGEWVSQINKDEYNH